MVSVTNRDSGSVVQSGFVYTYDDAGNRIGVVEAEGDRVTWTYDLSSQLLSEHRDGANGYRLTYTYDATGNRLTQNDGTLVTTSVYDAANRIQTADDGTQITTYMFDHNGNQRTVETEDGITTYSWSYENQQTIIELPDDTLLTYTYAPVNRNSVELRVQSETVTETTHSLWDDQNLILEVDETSTVEAAYTLAPQPFGNLISQHRDAESSFYQFDALGSTRQLTDPVTVHRWFSWRGGVGGRVGC